MSLNDRLKKLESRPPTANTEVVMLIPDNCRGTPDEQAEILSRWAEYQRTGRSDRPIVVVPQAAPGHPVSGLQPENPHNGG